MAIITAVIISNKITEHCMGENDLSLVDPALLTMAVTKLVRLDYENTKLPQQQDEVILGTLNEGCKMKKTFYCLQRYVRSIPNTLNKLHSD